jgi:peptide chain release factor 2
MLDLGDRFKELAARVDAARGYLDEDGLRRRVADLTAETSRPGFWDDQERARKLSKQLADAESDLALLASLTQRLEDARTLDEMAREAADDDAQSEAIAECDGLVAELDRLELRSLFFDELDPRNAIVEIHPGAGGVESQDWAEILLRMYLRWAESSGLRTEVLEEQSGDEAGIKSATFTVSGANAYGSLLSERGVHRLVRISPFDSQSRRHTSFATVGVTPVFEEAEDDVDVRDEDLRIDTYRSSGAGGQHVNVTDSAVRITHLPTGVVVSCQNERSQLQNKARAMEYLKARLLQLQREEREAELAKIQGAKADIGWGSQVRSYVLMPYQMVKDLRSGYETSDVHGVLDGDLDKVIEAWLRWRRSGESARVSDDLEV